MKLKVSKNDSVATYVSEQVNISGCQCLYLRVRNNNTQIVGLVGFQMRSWINVRNGERLGVCPAWTQPLCGHQPSRITPILHPVIASSVHDSDPWLLVSPGSSHFSQTHQQTHPFWELPAASASADLGTL